MGPWGNKTYHVPACDFLYSPLLCTNLYHDQEQTPSGTPDGRGLCQGKCDVGGYIPVGEYLFDHRNESLRDWLVDEHIMGPNCLGQAQIDGLFIDDFWCSNLINGTGNCNDPVSGASEIDFNQVAYI